MNKQQKKGFTLVELVVVISILAILSTMGILALKGYKEKARDSKRIADISSLSKALDISSANKGELPYPDDGITISSGSIAIWEQGTIGNKVIKGFKGIDDVFIDPLTNTEYSYSITSNKKEFQIGTILETDDLALSPISSTNAVLKKMKAYVAGNYNGYIVKIRKGSNILIFDSPSIITNDLDSIKINEIHSNKSFVFNGYGNIPSIFKGNDIVMDGGFNYSGSVLLYDGHKNDLLTDSNIISIATKLKNTISNSDLVNTKPYSDIKDLDLSQTGAVSSLITPILTGQ